MAKKDKRMTATGTIALATAAPQLGQDCVFDVTTTGLHGKQFPRVYVEAKQGGHVVYGEIRELDAPYGSPHPTGGPCTFEPLGGGSSDWLNDTPPYADAQAPAFCTARLFYADQHGAQIDLAPVITFEAAGL